MSSIISQQVISELLEIARSNATLKERRAAAVQRIEQYKSDLAAPRLKPGLVKKQRDELARKLKVVAEYRGADVGETIIFMEAHEALTRA